MKFENEASYDIIEENEQRQHQQATIGLDRPRSGDTDRGASFNQLTVGFGHTWTNREAANDKRKSANGAGISSNRAQDFDGARGIRQQNSIGHERAGKFKKLQRLAFDHSNEKQDVETNGFVDEKAAMKQKRLESESDQLELDNIGRQRIRQRGKVKKLHHQHPRSSMILAGHNGKSWPTIDIVQPHLSKLTQTLQTRRTITDDNSEIDINSWENQGKQLFRPLVYA